MYIVNTVRGHSMLPSLHDGDTLLVSNSKSFDVGDIVVIKIAKKFRHDNQKYVIKRIVAIENDVVYSYHDDLYVNDKKVKDKSMGKTKNIQQTIVPKNHVYVLGDNREHSMDSRIFGCVNIKNIIGKAERKINRNQLRHTSKGYKPKSLKESFQIVKKEIYHKWGLED